MLEENREQFSGKHCYHIEGQKVESNGYLYVYADTPAEALEKARKGLGEYVQSGRGMIHLNLERENVWVFDKDPDNPSRGRRFPITGDEWRELDRQEEL
tara:strand:- start:53 stop:349 length:297 start_codon:yes stop_codon:yes gene_type:complete